MNPNTCRVVLRPRGPLEVFDLSWRLLRARWGALVRLSLLLFTPIWLVGCAVGWFVDWHWGVAPVVLFAAFALRLPFVVMTGRLLFSERVRVRDVFRDAFGNLGGYLQAWLGLGVQAALGAVTCGLSVPVVGFVTHFLPEVLLLERVRAGRVLRRCSRLSAGGAPQVIAGLLGSVVLVGWFVGLTEAAGQAVVGFLLQLGQPVGSAWNLQATPFVLAGILVAMPIVSVYRLLLYVDVRTRQEGWDLQVGLRALSLASERP